MSAAVQPPPIRKVGRGGAGNFYTRADAEAAAQYAATKVAAFLQKITPTTPVYDSSVHAKSRFASCGRGGAGNTVDKGSLSHTTDSSSANMSAHNAQQQRYHGRGGVGNYDDGSKASTTAAEVQAKRPLGEDAEAGSGIPMEDLSSRMVDLKPPEKVYMSVGRTKPDMVSADAGKV